MINNILRSRRLGFTLIELLVVIGVLAVIAAGVVALIDPVDKLNQANDAKAQNDMGQIATAIQSYAAQNNGYFPPNTGTITTSGELVTYPVPASGYTYTYTAAPAACTTSCTSVVISSTLKAKRYVNATPSTPFWTFCTSTGRSGPAATAATCP